jgi:hypothetical protein
VKINQENQREMRLLAIDGFKIYNLQLDNGYKDDHIGRFREKVKE